MSQATFIPVPYFQFAPYAREFDFAAHGYKPVPNKKINCHCPFIIIDADYINEPLMDVAVAAAEDVTPEALETDSGIDANQQIQNSDEAIDKSNTASDAANTETPRDNIDKALSDSTTELNEEDEEAARKEKERLDYLARQEADPCHNNVNSFKTVETPENPSKEGAAKTGQTQDAGTQNNTDDNDSENEELALPDYEAMPEEVSDAQLEEMAAKEANHSDANTNTDINTETPAAPDTQPKAALDNTDSESAKKEKKDSKRSKKDKEELTEEEQLKKDKEAKLESYKQFVAEQESQVEVDYQGIRVSIEANALPSRMYFIMNALSAIIASYGLVINSAAVVIGAMLVAMMLGPISGVALAIIDYRMPFLRKSLMTVLAGGAMVVSIGFIVGFLHQDTPLSNEILSRTQPTSMDLMIALAGGTAGAYAMISPHLSVAVVGVAVATALVPPLAASGILFAHGQLTLSFGALLLAITNIVAIQFTNALVLWFTGFRRLMEEDYKSSPVLAFFRRNAVPLLLLAAIGVYLTYNFNTITKRQTFENTVKEDINNYFIEKGNALTATQFVNREDHQTIRAVVRGETRPSSSDAQYLEQVVNKTIEEDYPKYLPVRIQLRYMPVVVIESSPEHTDTIDQTDVAILSNE